MRIAIIGSGYVGRFIYRIINQNHKCDIYHISNTKDIKKNSALISNHNGSYHVWGGVFAIPNYTMAKEYSFSKKAVAYLNNYVQNNLTIERLYNFRDSSILSVKVNDKIKVPKIIKKTVREVFISQKTYFIDNIEYDEVIVATGSYFIPRLVIEKGIKKLKFEEPQNLIDKSIVIHNRKFNEWDTIFKKQSKDCFSYSIPIQLPVSRNDLPIVYNFLYIKLKNYKKVQWKYLLFNFHKAFKILLYKILGVSYSYYFTTTNQATGKEAIDFMRAYHNDASTIVNQGVKADYITEYHSNDFTYLNPVSFRLLSIIDGLFRKEILK
jgi:hypothetical protein